MKLSKIFLIIITLITLSSCSSNDDDPQNDSQVVIDSGENSNNNSSQNSDHLITTPSGNKVSSLLMSSSEYNDWKSNDQFSEASYREAIVKDIYKEFSDKYDFIFLVLNEEEIPEGINYYGKNIGVSNNITGIGGGTYDYTSDYGSSGKLKSVMQLSSLGFLQNGPALHELMHNWANYALPTENVETGNDVSSYSYSGHWGFTGGSTRGQLGGFNQSTLEDLGNNEYSVDPFGAFANGGNSVPYNELELYLMGMTPVNSVNQFDLFSDITSFVPSQSKYNFTANSKVTYGPNELESLLGVRSPSSLESQKEFDLLVIVLTDNPLTDSQWKTINDAADWFSFKGNDEYSSYNFWEATNGIGSINIGN